MEVSNPVLVINLWPFVTNCGICDVDTVGEFSVPIYEDEIMPDDYDGEWGGMPVCPKCFYLTRGLQEQNPGKKITFSQVRHLTK